MSEDDPDIETQIADMPPEMPVPPDIDSLIQKQQKNLQSLYQASAEMYNAYASRDQLRSDLAASLADEINNVFTIAAAVKTSQQALVSIPLVLAAANSAFAGIPAAQENIEATTAAALTKFTKGMNSPGGE